MSDQAAFEQAKKKVIGTERRRLGIGTLSEKSIHAILKNYYEPDEEHQEIPVENYVADIYRDGEIIEIQTRQFNKLRDKLSVFLPLYKVTVVYPVSKEKWLITMDAETGLLHNMRRSPAKGNRYTVFPELYKIKMFLRNPNLKLRLVLLRIEEYRLINNSGWDKTALSDTYDKIPTNLEEEIEINCKEDYMQFIPDGLKGPFTSKEFAAAAHIPSSLAQSVLNILYYVRIVTRVGKDGKQYLYEVMDF